MPKKVGNDTAPAAPKKDWSGKPLTELVVLSGGPYDGFWYTPEGWQQARRAAQSHIDTGAEPGSLSHARLLYEPTGEYMPNPRPEYAHLAGRIWKRPGRPDALQRRPARGRR